MVPSRKFPAGVPISKTLAFSLVEVTLALGVVSFCLVALVGLLPVGLNSLQTARSESAATNCMEQIAGSIRKSVAQPGGSYVASKPYNALTWSVGGSVVNCPWANLSASGFPTSAAAGKQFAAQVSLVPPKDVNTTGTAMISVAWPATATWDNTKSAWNNASGSIRTQIIFLPDR